MSFRCMPRDELVLVDAKRADRLAELPPVARHLIERKRTDGSDYVIYRGAYVAEFALSADGIERGTTTRLQAVVARLENALHAQAQQASSAGRALCLLAAEVEECDGTHLAVPITWRLDLVPSDARPGGAAVPFAARHVARSFVAEARQRWRAPSATKREALLADPLVYRDAHLPITFTAIDAWGFRADELMQNVARALGDGHFFIPLAYRYSGLLAQVHACTVLAAARAHPNALYAETLPRAAYELTGTREGYEIHGAALADAVEFIERRLLPALVVFDPHGIALTVAPCGAVRWTDIWATHHATRDNATAIKLPPTDANDRDIKCSLRIVAHFVALDPLPADAVGVQRLVAAAADSPRPVAAATALAAAESGASAAE